METAMGKRVSLFVDNARVMDGCGIGIRTRSGDVRPRTNLPARQRVRLNQGHVGPGLRAPLIGVRSTLYCSLLAFCVKSYADVCPVTAMLAISHPVEKLTTCLGDRLPIRFSLTPCSSGYPRAIQYRLG